MEGMICAVICVREDAVFTGTVEKRDIAEVRGKLPQPELRCICGRNLYFPGFPAREQYFFRDVLLGVFSVRTGP